MSSSRIQGGSCSSDYAGRIQPGDLVKLEDYFFDDMNREELESFTGIVTRIMSSEEAPALLEIFWTDGSFENLYEDEVAII